MQKRLQDLNLRDPNLRDPEVSVCNCDETGAGGRGILDIKTILVIWLVIINLVSLALFYSDKQRARKHQWRISEATLFLSALIGGSIGAIAGMYLFHHKTKHWYFVIGMPLILIAQIIILWWLWQKGILA